MGGHRRFAEDGNGIAGGGDDDGIAGGGDDNGIASGGDGGGDDNEWRWSDGSPLLTFKNWFPGLPDDTDIITGGPESCLMVSISFLCTGELYSPICLVLCHRLDLHESGIKVSLPAKFGSWIVFSIEQH